VFFPREKVPVRPAFVPLPEDEGIGAGRSKKIIKQIAREKDDPEEQGMTKQFFLGGEPFLRSDILELLHIAKNTFKWVGVSTNGTLIPRLTDKQMQELKKLNEQGLNIQ
jgi:MoaA/NifB/PqqE/SkfB family radical SAM enzyme